MKVIELREKASFEADAARKIKDAADSEGRGLTEAEVLDFNKHLRESERYEQEADLQQHLEETETRLQSKQDRKSTPEIVATGERVVTADNTSMFRFGQLRAFKGPTAERDAYYSGKWLMATVMGDAAARQWCRDKGVEMRIQTEGINAAGGFVVPEVMERAIIDLRESYGVIRQNARVVPMSSDHMNIPRRAGGLTPYFVGETSEITASDKSWNQVELTAKKLACLTRLSTDLNEDAIINIADDLANEMAYAFALKEDQCGFDGDGTSTYGGMTGIRIAFVDGTHTAGQDAGTSAYVSWAQGTLADEIVTLMSLLPTYALPRAKWYISPAGKAGLLDRIALEGGGNTVLNIAAGTSQVTFLGYPIVVSAVLPTAPVNAEVAFLFGDLSLSTTFGDRRGITIKVSTERYLEYDQIGIQATERFVVVNHDLGDNTTAGPIVANVGTT